MAAAKTKTSSKTAAGSAGDPAIHDDFYRNLRAKIDAWAKSKNIDASYRDYILLVPDMFHFLTQLMMEPKVAIKDKAWVGIAVAYVLSPIDFIPDALFPLGLIDDLIVMVIVLDSVLGNVPRGFVKKHWAGSGDLFTAVRESLAKADEWVGKGMFRKIKSYLKKQGIWDPDAQPATPPPVPKAAETPAAKKATKKRTPSRRPAAKKAVRKATPKAAAKKTAKKTTKKKAAKKVAKKTTKTTPAKRTIAGKKAGKKSGSSSSSS
jgi:uncharacterized membrane protein YkvA (DUF1232 family)